jgi:hypothetical protein
MDTELEQLGTGAHESANDPRTFDFSSLVTAGSPLVKGGIIYNPEDFDHQHKVGICTAICLTQNRQKANGRKYSPDFQYLLQKKYYDFNWYEGSSIFNALRVGKNFGFLPTELFPHVTEADRFLSYGQYIAKLQAISDAEITRLIGLCIDKIPGYAAVNVNDPQAIAKAIDESKAGILCMYGCGDTWWTSVLGKTSWYPKDINPLRLPVPFTSGHAVGLTAFDYSEEEMQKIANSWGNTWNLNGNADINWSEYPMKEAWVILETTPVPPVFKYTFTKTLRKGMSGPDVTALQTVLKMNGEYIYPSITGYFGTVTEMSVKAFQTRYRNEILIPAGVSTPTGIVGPNTIKKLNALFSA